VKKKEKGSSPYAAQNFTQGKKHRISYVSLLFLETNHGKIFLVMGKFDHSDDNYWLLGYIIDNFQLLVFVGIIITVIYMKGISFSFGYGGPLYFPIILFHGFVQFLIPFTLVLYNLGRMNNPNPSCSNPRVPLLYNENF
jgi:hypothetical protein